MEVFSAHSFHSKMEFSFQVLVAHLNFLEYFLSSVIWTICIRALMLFQPSGLFNMLNQTIQFGKIWLLQGKQCHSMFT